MAKTLINDDLEIFVVGFVTSHVLFSSNSAEKAFASDNIGSRIIVSIMFTNWNILGITCGI